MEIDVRNNERESWELNPIDHIDFKDAFIEISK